MKKLFLTMILTAVLFSVPAWAETMYVSDILKITLRSGAGTDHKILKMLESGQRVEVVDSNEQWAKVQLPNGTEGWVLKRFITPEKTSRLVLEKLGKKHEQLLAQFSARQKENTQLKDENKRISTELEKNITSLGNTSKEYETLKKNSADFLKLETNYKNATAQLSEQTQLNEKLIKENVQNYIKAGLCGAGVLLLGFIIGFATKRPRQRSSLL